MINKEIKASILSSTEECWRKYSIGQSEAYCTNGKEHIFLFKSACYCCNNRKNHCNAQENNINKYNFSVCAKMDLCNFRRPVIAEWNQDWNTDSKKNKPPFHLCLKNNGCRIKDMPNKKENKSTTQIYAFILFIKAF